MGLFDTFAFWRTPAAPPPPLLSDWFKTLAPQPPAARWNTKDATTFTHEQLKLPPCLRCDNLMIYNGVRAPGGTAVHIEHIVIYGSKTAFRMLGIYLIAAALRIKYDEPVVLLCINGDLSPCSGLRIGIPLQSKLEQSLHLAPGILTQWSWTPQIPDDKPTHWINEFKGGSDHPVDHLPWVRLGSPEDVYSEQHRPRSKMDIVVHLRGTLPSLCWLGRGLLNFALDDNPCHTVSLLNYGGHNCLASGSAELRFVTPGGVDVDPSISAWLESQRPSLPPPPPPRTESPLPTSPQEENTEEKPGPTESEDVIKNENVIATTEAALTAPVATPETAPSLEPV